MKAPLTLRVVGDASNRRDIVSYGKVVALYAAADPAIQPELPSFLGAFTYPRAMKTHFERTGSTRGYVGPCGVPELRFDLDDEDIEEASRNAHRLFRYLADRYAVPTIFVSGSKGYHLSVPTGGSIEPASPNPRIARSLAARIAEDAGVPIDLGVYDAVRLWRAPNSRHQRTGLFKVIIPDPDDLPYLDLSDLRGRAARPVPYVVEAPSSAPQRLVDDWLAATVEVQRLDAETRERKAGRPNGSARMNPLTWTLIREPESIEQGGGGRDGTFQGRHKAIFSAAANLAEFGTLEALIHGLLFGPGRDTGLRADEVTRQIASGIEFTRRRQLADHQGFSSERNPS